jgi:hypothetical protein
VLHAHANAHSASQLFSLWRGDPTPRHRVWACELAERFQVADSGSLRKLTDDDNGHVRKAARLALTAIEKPV